MDRDTLLGLIANMEDGTLTVTICGDLRDSEGDDYTVSDAEEALAELETTVARFKKILAWAKTAPEIGV